MASFFYFYYQSCKSKIVSYESEYYVVSRRYITYDRQIIIIIIIWKGTIQNKELLWEFRFFLKWVKLQCMT